MARFLSWLSRERRVDGWDLLVIWLVGFGLGLDVLLTLLLTEKLRWQ